MTRRRWIVAGIVVAFALAFAGIGLVSRSTGSNTEVTTAAATSATSGTAPSAMWYWTMAVSPSDPNVLVLATSGGLYRSTDGGKTWQPTGPKGFNSTSVLQDGDRLLAAGVKVAGIASPVVRNGQGRSAANGPALVVASTDDGKTWTALHPRGLPNVGVQALATSPDGKTMYAVLTSGRFLTSTDGGASFELAAPKLGIPPWALAVAQGNHFLGGDMDTGAYASPNGRAWQRQPYKDTRGGKMVMEYAVKPSDSNDLLMSAFGVEQSTDGGKMWHPALKSTVMFGPVAWSKSAADTAYAVGFDGSVWKTTDAGKTWNKM
jgi:photosystem II stability/assembly factor-like uncharacterized protein